MAAEGNRAVSEVIGRPDASYVRKFGREALSGVELEERRTGAVPEGTASPRVQRRDAVYRRSLALSDAAAAAAATCIAAMALGNDRLTPLALLLLPVIVVVGKILGLYDRDQNLVRKTTLGELPSLFQVATIFGLFVWFTESLTVKGALSKPQVGATMLLVLGLMALGREVVRQVVKRVTGPERCVVLGDAESAQRLAHKFQISYSMRAELIGRVPLEPEPKTARSRGPEVLGSMGLLGLVLEVHNVERVILAPHTARSEEILEAIRIAKSLGVKVSLLPRMLDVVGSSVEFDDVDGITLLGLRGFGLSKSSQLLKRAMDLAGAVLVTMAIAPLLAWIALAIKLTSRGPVLFRQKRIGRDGKPFEMFKFRTMYDGADAMKADLHEHNEAAEGLFKIADDPRITRVGRFLRRASLDELPQLFNVLRGEMSLVGPRPLVVDEDSRIKGWQRQRLNVAPGMTGYWQVLGSSRVPRAEMVKIDYLYGANWSLWVDVKILLRTVPHVFARRGL